MATYIITINERTKAGKYIVGLLREMKSIVTFKSKSTGLDEALKNAKDGEIFKAENAEELVNKCLENTN